MLTFAVWLAAAWAPCPAWAGLQRMVDAVSATPLVLRPMVAASATVLQRMVEISGTITPTNIVLRPMAPPLPSSHKMADLHPMETRKAPVAVALRRMAAPEPVMVAEVRPMVAAKVVEVAELKPMVAEMPKAVAVLRPMAPTAEPMAKLARLKQLVRLADLAPLAKVSPMAAAQETLSRGGTRQGEVLERLTGVPTPVVSGTVLLADGNERAESPTVVLAVDTLPPQSEDKLLLLDVMLNRIRASEAITAYATDTGDVWLPFEDMIAATGLALKVDAGRGVVEGFILREDNTFRLDMAAKTLDIGGKTVAYPDGMVARGEGGLYVLASQLEKWLPVKTKLDMNELRLTMSSTKPLPREELLAREKDWEKLEREREEQMAAVLKNAVTLPYQAFTMPQLRLDGSANMLSSGAVGKTFDGGLSVQAEGDLLYGTGNLTLNIARDANGEVRLNGSNFSIERRELSPTLLGPLKATTVLAGDIAAAQLSLADITTRGRGMRVNNLPFNQVDDPDRFVLRGEAPVGWDVEIYQNDQLLDFQRVSADGRYNFAALPLRVGLNTFRIVQHGPQGQQRESEEEYYLGGNMLAQGQAGYDVSVYQPGQNMLVSENSQAASSTLGMVARLDYGITSDLTGSLGTFSALGDTSATSTQGVTAGLRASYASIYNTLDVMGESGGQTAFAVSSRANLLDALYGRVIYSAYQGYAEGSGKPHSQMEAELEDLRKVGKLSVGNTGGYRRTLTDYNVLEQAVRYRLALGYKGYSFTNTLEHAWRPELSTTSGEAELSANIAGSSVHAGLLYEPGASQPLRSVRVQAQTPLTDEISLDSSISKQLRDGRSTDVVGHVRYNAGPLALGLRGQASDAGNYGLGLTVGTLLVPQEGGAYALRNPSYGSGGGKARIRVFVDGNENGTYEQGETLLKDVAVMNRGRGSEHRTNANGVAVVDNLPAYNPVQLDVDEATLPDIYLKADGDALAVVSHPGADAVFDLPVRLYGEINGVLTLRGAKATLKGVRVEALNNRGEMVAYATADEDGFFSISPLPLGTYTLRAQAGTGVKKAYRLTAPARITLTAKDNLPPELTLEIEENGGK